MEKVWSASRNWTCTTQQTRRLEACVSELWFENV
jgi:hypothetical protein